MFTNATRLHSEEIITHQLFHNCLGQVNNYNDYEGETVRSNFLFGHFSVNECTITVINQCQNNELVMRTRV